jgi:site-specific DNA-methyltransferase (adenine-specific)/adenine-specific DNA-methyltransferase
VAALIWQKVYSPKSTAKHFSEDHDYIIVYAKQSQAWRPNLVPRGDEQDKRYKNRDNDPRGPWKPGGLDARNPYSKGTYAITCPSGRVIEGPPTGAYWRVSQDKLAELDADGRIWWGKNGNSVPQLKRFLCEVKAGLVPQTLWTYEEVGHTQEAKQELVDICDFDDSASVFITPKPLRLLRRVLQVAADKDSVVLDSFAGSGTTGHAVFKANQQDGGHRRFILVEMEPEICRTVTAQRLTRAIQGYTRQAAGGKTEEVAGLGGGFRYCTLAEPLFDESGAIRPDVTFAELAAHVFFTETGEPIPKRASGRTPLIGVCKGTAYYLLFNGVLGDRRPNGGNVLTSKVLAKLPAHDGPKVVYGEGCRLAAARLKRENIVFKQVPYEVKTA